MADVGAFAFERAGLQELVDALSADAELFGGFLDGDDGVHLLLLVPYAAMLTGVKRWRIMSSEVRDMTNAKSQYARDARNLSAYHYVGETIPSRADGLSLPLPAGSSVYLDGRPGRRRFVTVNTRPDGFGSSYYVRAIDLAVAS